MRERIRELEFAQYLCSVCDNGTYTVAEADALGSFIPIVPTWLWNSVVHEMTERRPYTFRLVHSSRGALEHRLRALTNRSFQPVPTVLIGSNAAAALLRPCTTRSSWIFGALVDTIETEASAIPHVGNNSVARRLLHELRLVLPYHVYPMDTPIPEVNLNFFRNILLVHQHGLVFRPL
ncbi:hypothetical protein MRX96_055311 [Rhipicephalus microplus]